MNDGFILRVNMNKKSVGMIKIQVFFFCLCILCLDEGFDLFFEVYPSF